MVKSPTGVHYPMHKPKLLLQGKEVNTVDSYRYPGIVIDNKLTWRKHEERAIDNATKWVMQCCCLARTNMGLSPRIMQQLYISVAMPKMTYGAEIWYNPPWKKAGTKQKMGSARVTCQLMRVQQMASLTINRVLDTTPTDTLDIHADIFPPELTLLNLP